MRERLRRTEPFDRQPLGFEPADAVLCLGRDRRREMLAHLGDEPAAAPGGQRPPQLAQVRLGVGHEASSTRPTVRTRSCQPSRSARSRCSPSLVRR